VEIKDVLGDDGEAERGFRTQTCSPTRHFLGACPARYGKRAALYSLLSRSRSCSTHNVSTYTHKGKKVNLIYYTSSICIYLWRFPNNISLSYNTFANSIFHSTIATSWSIFQLIIYFQSLIVKTHRFFESRLCLHLVLKNDISFSHVEKKAKL